MPTNLDFLLERLKYYDEVTLLELLDISSEEILEKFGHKVRQRKVYLLRELEIINIDDPELDDEDPLDGFQVEYEENKNG